MRIIYSRVALNDVIGLRELIAIESPVSAKEISDGLVKGIKTLPDFPPLGKEVSQAPRPKTIRDLILGKYIVRYLVLDQSIYILKIWHHRENRS